MDEVHKRANEFCIRPEARHVSEDSAFDPTNETEDKSICLVCDTPYGAEKKSNHLSRKHLLTLPAHQDKRRSCPSCAAFKDFEKDIMCVQLPWTVAESSKPEHIEACKREFDYELRCPACLKGPIKWSK